MIIRLSPDAAPTLDDVDRLDRLHAECDGSLADMATGPLCEPDPDGAHVWLDIAEARSQGELVSADDGFADHFDAMIAYAVSKGWTNPPGTHVRAHVQPTAPSEGAP